MYLFITFIIARTLLSIILSAGSLLALAPITGIAGLFAPVVAMLLAAFASNKVEGIALRKGFGIVMLGPLAGYFLQSNWQRLLGTLHTY